MTNGRGVALMLAVALSGGAAAWAQEKETQNVTLSNRVEVTTQDLGGGTRVKILRELPAVEVEVEKRKPKPPPETAPHKARLAVMTARIPQHLNPVFKASEEFRLLGDLQVRLKAVVSAENESRLEAPCFTLALEQAFVGSRKFNVLERARLEQVLDELDFGESDYGDPARVVPLGKALNAEYLVLPELIAMEWLADNRIVPYVDRGQTHLRGKMIVMSRITDVATGTIVSSVTEEVQVERRLKPNEPFPLTAFDSLLLDLYALTATRLVHRALEAVYPVRLLDVSGDRAVLNRGEGAVAVGDEFTVFALGAGYVDPDTQESLGRRETEIARIRVVAVKPRMSEAQITSGADALRRLPDEYLCRETRESIERKTTLSKTMINW